MTSLRWLQFPTPRRAGGHITLAHAFPVTADGLGGEALCGIKRIFGSGHRIVTIVHPGEPHERCKFCDDALRDLGGPHPPKRTFDATLYDPVHTFEEWATLDV